MIDYMKHIYNNINIATNKAIKILLEKTINSKLIKWKNLIKIMICKRKKERKKVKKIINDFKVYYVLQIILNILVYLILN